MISHKDYISLHTHTDFSLLDGMIRPAKLAEQVSKLGGTAVAITDHGNIDGWHQHKLACDKFNLKPIFGCEIYTIPEIPSFSPSEFKSDKKLKIKRNHLTILVRNAIGFKNLNKILTRANLEFFFDRPCVPFDVLLNASEGLTILTGCPSSPFWRRGPDGIDDLEKAIDVFKDHIYAEIMPMHDLEMEKEICARALSAAKVFNIKPVCTNDIHYLESSDCETHEVLLAMSRHSKWNNPKRWKFDTKLVYLRDPEEMLDSLKKLGIDDNIARQAILNSRHIADTIDFNLPQIKVDLPSPLPPSVNGRDYLYKKCLEGLHGIGKSLDEDYMDRLIHELDIIIKLGFVNYFLILEDLCTWCKKSGILRGPSRGSVAGSLTAYLLGITSIDPIPHGLLFERFIDVSRTDLPDIDLDYQDDKCELVHSYLMNKYGQYNVAFVSTFLTIKGKLAIRDVARVFEADPKLTDDFSKNIEMRRMGEDYSVSSILETTQNSSVGKKYLEKYPEVIYHAVKLEDTVKTTGIHAAGIIISNKDLREGDHCVLVKKKDQRIAINIDKYAIDHFGLMKLDVLRLKNLTEISRCLDLIEKRHNTKINLNKLALTDQKTYEEISNGNTATAFQLGSKGMQKYSKDLAIENFDEIVAAIALYRPGPQGPGYHRLFIDRKFKRSNIPSLGPIYDDITKNTYGLIVYQEQVMLLLHKLAGFTWQKADKVRKIMGKKLGTAEIMKFEQEFVDGCKNLGTLPEYTAKKIFGEIASFSLYAFNKAHCVPGDTLVYVSRDRKELVPVKIIDLFCRFANGSTKTVTAVDFPFILMFNGKFATWGNIKEILKTATRKLLHITTRDGRSLRCSAMHRIGVYDSNKGKCKWIQARYLKPGTTIIATGFKEINYGIIKCEYDEIKSINDGGEEECFDLEVIPPFRANKFWGHSYFAGDGILTHNSVGYGTLAYQTMWLKTHFPIEWMCSVMNSGIEGKTAMTGELTKIDEAIAEARRMGIKIKNPDINKSQLLWTIEDDKTLRASLGTIKGVGDRALEELSLAKISKSNFNSIEDLANNVNRRVIHIGVLESIIQSGAMDSILNEDAVVWKKHFRELWESTEKKRKEKLDEYRKERDKIEKFDLPEIEEKQQSKLAYQIDRDPVKKYSAIRKRIQEQDLLITGEKIDELRDMGLMLGYFTTIRFGHAENDSAYAYFEDGTKFCRLSIDKYLAKQKRKLLESIAKKPVMIQVIRKNRSIICTGVWSLDDIRAESNAYPLPLIVPLKDSIGIDVNAIRGCTACNLRSNGVCTSPVPMKPGKLPVMILGESPGEEEDSKGEGFVGRAGKLLFSKLGEVGLDRDLFYIHNVVSCRPVDNKLQGTKNVDICTDLWVDKEIKSVKPILILSLGNYARYFFTGEDSGIKAANSQVDWSSKYGCWVMYGIHPSAALRDQGGEMEKLFDETIAFFAKTILMLTGEE